MAGIESSERAISIVDGINQICSDTLDILVIAEGVETEYEHDALSQIGVGLLQGARFASPQRGFENPWANGAPASSA